MSFSEHEPALSRAIPDSISEWRSKTAAVSRYWKLQIFLSPWAEYQIPTESDFSNPGLS
jgi:hypothetical protein